MTMLIKTLAAIVVGAWFITDAAQSTREVSGASPYVAIENEPPPKLNVDPPPLAAGLAHDIDWIQYHAENVRIVPVFGAVALNVSPRIGHLHIHMDNLPWGWVEATGDNNTISVAGLPPGQHSDRGQRSTSFPMRPETTREFWIDISARQGSTHRS